jgi:hypothetical protein
MKFFAGIACACLGLAFFGCSGDSTNASADDSAYYIVDVRTYELKQNALQLTEGLCEVQNGKLVWSKNGPSYTIPAQLDESAKSLRLSFRDGVIQFGYIGNTFPIGEFRGQSTASKNIDGVVLEKDNVLKFVLFKRDNCFFDDYDFPVTEGTRRVDCNTEVDTNGVLIKFKPFEGNSVKMVYSAGKVTCNYEVKTRYSYNEQDCKDAYNDFLKDSSAAATFEFKNYKTQLIEDEECVKELAAELYKNKG